MGHALLPNLDDINLARLQFGHLDDFTSFVTGDEFTDTSADTGAAVAMTDAVGGVVTLTTGATDNNECYLLTTKEVILIAADKPFVVESRIKYTEANTDDANVAFGVMNAVAADSIVDNGAGPKTNYSGAVFYKVDGGTTWIAQASDGTTQTAVTLSAANSLTKTKQTPGGGTWQTLRIEGIPVSSTAIRFHFYIDGVLVQVIEATYASATEAMVFVGVKAGDTNSEVVSVDYIGYAQRR